MGDALMGGRGSGGGSRTPATRILALLPKFTGGNDTRIADVRSALRDIPDAELTDTLKQLDREGKVQLEMIPQPYRRTGRDTAAAIMLGGEPMHTVHRR